MCDIVTTAARLRSAFIVKAVLGFRNMLCGCCRETVGDSFGSRGLQEIAETKLPDLNCSNVEAAMRIVEGTAKNMGIKVEQPAAA